MFEQLEPAEVARRMAGTPGVVLLDVREPWERAQAAIEPSLHIPMQEVPQRIGELPRDRPIVVYCHSGHRSAMVAAYLTNSGLKGVANLSGGIEAWSTQVDPQVPRY
jgi:rhodanese-related sulfurtransferase